MSLFSRHGRHKIGAAGRRRKISGGSRLILGALILRMLIIMSFLVSFFTILIAVVIWPLLGFVLPLLAICVIGYSFTR